jgi:aspartyl-tRNA synthetase
MIAAARGLSSEDVVQVEGEVVNRPPEAVNPEMATGSIEVHVDDFRVISEAAPLPILVADVDQEALPAEELRLRHRS